MGSGGQVQMYGKWLHHEKTGGGRKLLVSSSRSFSKSLICRWDTRSCESTWPATMAAWRRWWPRARWKRSGSSWRRSGGDRFCDHGRGLWITTRQWLISMTRVVLTGIHACQMSCLVWISDAPAFQKWEVHKCIALQSDMGGVRLWRIEGRLVQCT